MPTVGLKRDALFERLGRIYSESRGQGPISRGSWRRRGRWAGETSDHDYFAANRMGPNQHRHTAPLRQCDIIM